MRLILKSLKQVEYEIYIQSEKINVKDLKNEIEKLYSFDSENIKLFFNGTILKNENYLSDYKITENCTIIIMNTKPKQLDNLNTNKSKPNESPQENPKIKTNVENLNKSNISKILNDNLTIQINSLVDMRFEKSQVEAAVKAANGRIDLAVEYLNTGIPDNINANINNLYNRPKVESDITKELKKQAGVIKMLCKDNKYRIFEILNDIKKNDPWLLRLITDYQNEFKTYLDSPITEEDQKNYEKIEHKADNIQKKNEEKRKKKQEEKEKRKKEKEEKEKEEKEEKIKDNNKEENINKKDNKENIKVSEENKIKEEKNDKMIVEKEIENNDNKREENQNVIKIENKEEKNDEVPKKEETKSNNNIDSNEKEIKNEIKEEKKEETDEIKENDNNNGKTKEKIETDKKNNDIDNEDKDKEKNNNIDYNLDNSLINQLNNN